jgi:hypothetical protein
MFINMAGVAVTVVVAAAAVGCILPEYSDRVVGGGGTQMASFRTEVVVRSKEQGGQVTRLPVQIHFVKTQPEKFQTVMVEYDIRTCSKIVMRDSCSMSRYFVPVTEHSAKKGRPVTLFVGIGHKRH